MTASDGSLVGVLRTYLRSFVRENLDDMLPAKVVSYDEATNRAVVQPLIMIGTADGKKLSRAQIEDIPVFRFGGGGFFMRMPIKPDDIGWLKANDRDTSLMFQRGGLEDWPNTERLHSFSDAIFIPDTIKDWSIDGANEDASVWQSMDGSVVIAMHAAKVVITAPQIELDGPVLATGNVSIEGSLDVGGSVAATGDVEGAGISLATHMHSGVTPGGGTTGAPVP